MNPPNVNQTLSVDSSAAGREAIRIIDELRRAGYVALLAGGCVRDGLLGRQPKDFDVATNAVPDQVRRVFGRRSTLAFGASFGVIGVQPPRGGEWSGHVTEVATFRSDGEYSDGRRPDSVTFGDARADALRRDFTINGLFYDPSSESVIDYVGGQEDLKRGILKTIGSADDRFDEDKLRMLRAVRFATTTRFTLDSETRAAIKVHADTIDQVSGERIGAEIRRILASPNAIDGLGLLVDTGLNRMVWPLLNGETIDAIAPIHRCRSLDSFEGTLAICLSVVDDSAESLRRRRSGWRLSNDEFEQVAFALSSWRTIAQADSLPWSQIQPSLVARHGRAAMELAAAISESTRSSLPHRERFGRFDAKAIEIVRDAIEWPGDRLDPPPLVDGQDLKQLGIPAGPAYRTLIQAVRDRQLDGKIATHQEAIDCIKSIRHDR